MGVPRRKVVTVVVILALVSVGARAARVIHAQGRTSSSAPVQTLKNTFPAKPATSGDRGVTYHSLEAEAVKVTTRFGDAVAIADRSADGNLLARLTDLAGNDLNTLRVRHVDVDNDSLEFTAPGRPTKQAARRPGLRPTLDWSNQQAYSLWKDRNDTSSLEWQDTLMRPTGARTRDVEAAAVLTETEWRGGFSATVTKKTGTHVSYVTGRTVTGTVFISSFKWDGTEVGSSQWWPDEKAFAWSFPGLTQGYVDPSRLQRVGGWQLTPDMAWMNTQNYAFYRFHMLVKMRGSVSERQKNWFERLGARLVPIVFANEPGCDYLHWLDSSVYRPCCDIHDMCYQAAQPPCSSSSWWQWWSSWTCTQCNMEAAVCFATGGTHIYQRYP
jgi:hypothetical protein